MLEPSHVDVIDNRSIWQIPDLLPNLPTDASVHISIKEQ